MDRYRHRAGFGVWINDIRDKHMRTQCWPNMIYDDETDRCLKSCIDAMSWAGYNEFCLWGLLNSYSWSSDLSRERDPIRVAKVKDLIEYASDRGIKIIYGLGVYSWGCDEIIRKDPKVRGTNPHAMCPASEDSFKYVTRIIDFLFSILDVPGIHLESADQGRCHCENCRKIDSFTYHCALNRRTAEYIKSRWPDKVVMVNMISWQSWDKKVTVSDRHEIDKLIELSKTVDYIIDPGHIGHYIDPAALSDIASRLSCDLGTAGGLWLYYSPSWERLRTFLPYTKYAYDHLTHIYMKGGRACEYYAGPFINPSAEINTMFAGKVLSEPEGSYRCLLDEVLDKVYKPKSDQALAALADIYINAENAWFSNWNGHISADYDPVQNPSDLSVTFSDFKKYYNDPDTHAGQIMLKGVSHLTNHIDSSRYAFYRNDLIGITADVMRLLGATGEDARIFRIAEGLANTIEDLSELEEYEKWQ